MREPDNLKLLVRDLIQVSQSLAFSLERIVTSFEQITGRIPDERELSVVVSQFAGLHIRAEELLRDERAP
jgi:hypothetical protein